jgi:periplasmic protein TonB
VADKRTLRRNLSRLAGAVFAVLMIFGFVWFVHTMMGATPGKKQRQVQIVQVIRPPPPPPPDQPPPPPPEKSPEPLPKDVPEPTPEQQPDQAPEQPLGVDAEGSAGGDAFGLAARRGGSDLIGGTGTAPFAWYTNRMRDSIRDRLTAAACTKSAKGSVSTRILVAADGRVKQIKLTTSTGNARVDDCVDKALESITSLGDAPPPGMPEQVNLKVVF